MKTCRRRDFRIPDRFKEFKTMLVALPERPEYDVIYDLQMQVIWINTAASPDANVACVEFSRE